MDLRLVFLEGAERDFAIERSWEEWNASRPREAHRRFWETLLASPWGRKHWRIPAMRTPEGETVASMALFDLAFLLGGRKIRVGGIASFAVRKDLRKGGIGTRFMDEVHALLAREGYDAALLFSAIGSAYYERLGYAVLPTLQFEAALGSLKDVPARPSVAPAVRAYGENDFPAIREIYNVRVAQQRMGLLRDDEYWDIELLRGKLAEELFTARTHPWTFLVAEREGRTTAYLRNKISDVDGALLVLEYGHEAGAGDDVSLMIRFLLERLDPRPVKLRGLVPSRFENLCPARHMKWEEERMMMVRPVADGFRFPDFEHPDEYFLSEVDWF